MTVTAINKRGGSCRNPFAGRHRLDKLDLAGPTCWVDEVVDVESGTDPHRLLWLDCLKDACHLYLYGCLGDNKIREDEWWWATEWLLNVRATKPGTWEDAPRLVREQTKGLNGRRTWHTAVLTEDEVAGMCLDRLWDFFRFPWTLETFTSRLIAVRRSIVRESWRQIADYLRLPGKLADWEHALVRPDCPETVERLLSYRRKHKAMVLQMATNPEAQPESAQAEAA